MRAYRDESPREERANQGEGARVEQQSSVIKHRAGRRRNQTSKGALVPLDRGCAGFSLLEILMVAGLMGATSLISSAMTINMLKGQRYVTLKYAYQTFVNEAVALLATPAGCGATLASTNSTGVPNFPDLSATPVPDSTPAMMAYDIPAGIFYPAPGPPVAVALPSGNTANYFYQSPTNLVVAFLSAPDANNAIGYYGGPSGLQITQAQLRYKVGSVGTLLNTASGSTVLWTMYLYLQAQAYASKRSRTGATVLSGEINATGPQYFESPASLVNVLFDGNATTDPTGSTLIGCVGGTSAAPILSGGGGAPCAVGYFAINGGCGDCHAYNMVYSLQAQTHSVGTVFSPPASFTAACTAAM